MRRSATDMYQEGDILAPDSAPVAAEGVSLCWHLGSAYLWRHPAEGDGERWLLDETGMDGRPGLRMTPISEEQAAGILHHLRILRAAVGIEVTYIDGERQDGTRHD